MLLVEGPRAELVEGLSALSLSKGLCALSLSKGLCALSLSKGAARIAPTSGLPRDLSREQLSRRLLSWKWPAQPAAGLAVDRRSVTQPEWRLEVSLVAGSAWP